MKNEYIGCYQTLGIQPGCTWPQLRTEYRKLVRQWHPDRYQQEPKKKALAEEKLKEINKAFENLSRYRDAFGYLPSDLPASPATSPPQSWGEPGMHPAQDHLPPDQHDGFDLDWEHPRPTAKPKRYRLFRLVLISLVFWLAYVVWRPPSPATKSQQDIPAQLPAPVITRSESDAQQAPKTLPGDGRTFTIGSSREQVLEIQGSPTRISHDAWYYGKSKVYFANGAVIRWKNDPDNPLQVDLTASIPSSQLTSISVGSTKAQVRAIQGRPLRESDREWDYGSSKVYFNRDRVTGWYSSPFDPLKTAQ